MHADSDTDMWMARPLASTLLQYAAADIVRIAALYTCFAQRGYLSADEPGLLRLSTKFVTMHRIEGRPDPANVFSRGPYLPLCILPPQVSSRSHLMNLNPNLNPNLNHDCDTDYEADDTKRCVHCMRMIPLEHFPFVHKNLNTTTTRQEACKVCVLIEARMLYAESHKTTS